MLKQEFINYLEARPSRLKTGKKSIHTPRRYINALEKIITQDFSKEVILTIPNRQIFSFLDLDDFRKFLRLIKDDPYFEEANKYGNGDLNASLNAFLEFLEDKNITRVSDIILKEKVNQAPKYPEKSTVSTSVYRRDPSVSEYAKRRAKGKCQLCNQDAPFTDELGNPFLETHHIVWLSQGGADTAENTVALCPNCHRKMHHLSNEEDIKKLKNVAK